MKTMFSLLARSLVVAALWSVAGCDEEDTTKREVRVINESSAAIHVLLDDAEIMVVPASDSKSHTVSSGLHEVALVTDDGHKVWEQYIDLSEGQYAKFKINADGSIVASGGLTYDPSEGNGAVPSGADPELRVSNHLDEPVHIWIDGSEKKVVSSGDMRSVKPGNGKHSVQLKTGDERVLFSQTVSFKDGQYILYTVEHDGSVVATGGLL